MGNLINDGEGNGWAKEKSVSGSQQHDILVYYPPTQSHTYTNKSRNGQNRKIPIKLITIRYIKKKLLFSYS